MLKLLPLALTLITLPCLAQSETDESISNMETARCEAWSSIIDMGNSIQNAVDAQVAVQSLPTSEQAAYTADLNRIFFLLSFGSQVIGQAHGELSIGDGGYAVVKARIASGNMNGVGAAAEGVANTYWLAAYHYMNADMVLQELYELANSIIESI